MKVAANTRSTQGTSASRRLRHEGKVPGIIYGGKESGQAKSPQAIEIDHNFLFHALRKEVFHSSILEMDLDGKVQPVLLRTFQMHPWRQLVLHVDFQRVSDDEPITMRVPLHFSGQEVSPAVKESAAIIGHVRSEIEISCLPRDLPKFISVDLSGLTAVTNIKVKDITLPAGVKAVLHGKDNPTLVSVTVPAIEEVAAPAAADASKAKKAKK